MARMIPPRLSPDTKSGAEKKLFYKLQDMEGTNDWTILHSVGIAKHPTQSQGEADFIVIIPGGGVFILEVKGGGISFHEGRWESIDRNGITHSIKDPVYEANQAMHGFIDYLNDKISSSDPVSRTLFGFGVVFPDSEFHKKFSVPDLADEQIADFSDLYDMNSYLLGLSAFWKERKAPSIEIPDISACKEIVRLLRPEFDSHIPVARQIESIERQTLTLTERQQDIFEGLRDNERCLVRGSAGTGKTVIAIDLARELADEGKRVAFFCYNRQLAEYLKQNTESDGISFCGSFTDFMVNTVQQYSEDSIEHETVKDKDKFYRETLPSLFTEVFIENELKPFDCLVIDEAQDLMTEHYLDALDIILSDGLKEGNWYLFMDADRQNLFHVGMSYEDVKKILKEQKIYYTSFEFRENCRNSVEIIKEIDNLFGSTTRYPEVEDKGNPVVKKIYKRDKDQAKMLVDTINNLLDEKEGVKPEQITILSPNRLKNSTVERIVSEIPLSEKKVPGKIMFSTIDAFKGLENSVIIITDITDIRWGKDISRIYVGMTRAKSALYLFISESANRRIGKLKGEEKANE